MHRVQKVRKNTYFPHFRQLLRVLFYELVHNDKLYVNGLVRVKIDSPKGS